jgi:hypothetical protein
MKLKNICLAISIIGFAIGFSDARENIFFYLGRPVGAVFFILFFIFMLLENEAAKFDQETAAVAKKTKPTNPQRAVREESFHRVSA